MVFSPKRMKLAAACVALVSLLLASVHLVGDTPADTKLLDLLDDDVPESVSLLQKTGARAGTSKIAKLPDPPVLLEAADDATTLDYADETLACHGCDGWGTCEKISDKPDEMTQTDFDDTNNCSKCDGSTSTWPCGSEICYCKWTDPKKAGAEGTRCLGTWFTEEEEVMRYVKGALRLPGFKQPWVDTAEAKNNRLNVRTVIKALEDANTESSTKTAQANWEWIFTSKTEKYTYKKFLAAVAKFPAFCGAAATGTTLLDACKKTLAMSFAHFAQETGKPHYNDDDYRQGLAIVSEGECGNENPPDKPCAEYQTNCATATGDNACLDAQGNEAYGSPYDNLYFGRGAKQLSWSYNYGQFSEAMYDGDSELLRREPENVAKDGYLAIASGIWFASKTQPPKPSMTDIANGLWSPNSADATQNITNGFGATINIINGDLECGSSIEEEVGKDKVEEQLLKQTNRGTYYSKFVEVFGVEFTNDDKDKLSCEYMEDFTKQGAGDPWKFFESDWNSGVKILDKSKAGTWETSWPIAYGLKSINEFVKGCKAGDPNHKQCGEDADELVYCPHQTVDYKFWYD